ncbi:AAA family ATPase [Peptacetobacter hiranonis]|uniref:AAA family ATPase n=1 Tax=Peptacetobacter hiranonis TaxID=89152 RepID=UPI002E78560A|nr:AAA family ATPase [Peptacetobacter hiranonis]MEE0248477.1 AAA family ATPase [Peptacetobacter hiranonis]
MLKKFEVEGFKSFENKFTLDLAKANNYDYNRETVDNGIIRVCSIFGKNGSGKSNLGLALLDTMNHLTDGREKTSIATNPYLNLDRNDFAEFTYYFSFGNDDIIYNYRKVAVDELIYEKVDINGNIAIEYDYIEKKGYCNLEGAENLKVDLNGRGLSITKYIRNNSVLEDNEENRAFKKFYNYIENMILINSFDLNRCFGYEFRGELMESYIVKSGKLKEFEYFLKSLDIKCNLESINLDGREIILNKFKKGSVRFFETAPMGMRSLAMIYYCLVSDIDESMIFVDALDVYDCELAEKIVREMVKRKLSSQIIFTSHNTNLMTNELLCDRLLLDKYHETIKF